MFSASYVAVFYKHDHLFTSAFLLEARTVALRYISPGLYSSYCQWIVNSDLLAGRAGMSSLGDVRLNEVKHILTGVTGVHNCSGTKANT